MCIFPGLFFVPPSFFLHFFFLVCLERGGGGYVEVKGKPKWVLAVNLWEHLFEMASEGNQEETNVNWFVALSLPD